VLRRDPPLSHVTTFGGHPVSCAAAFATLQVLMEENLPARAEVVGQHVRKRLDHPLIREVRGRGAMLGMELISRDVTQKMVAHCLDDGVLLGWTLHSNTLVRIAPPLNIPLDVLDAALDTMIDALDAVRAA
jgi:4-aminobutyrate aminotransferase-like enzyme